MDDGETTPEETPGRASHLKAPWQPGQSGNPNGRPKGARNKFGEAFLEAMLADFEENGAAAIEACRKEKPDAYLKVAASILPRELNVKVSELDDLSDEQLDRRIAAVLALLEAGAGSAGDGARSTPAPESPGGISTLQ